MSACMSHRSSVSIDSGYTSISSDPLLNLSSSPMSYSAYRKKASTLDRVPHSSTMIQNQKSEQTTSEVSQNQKEEESSQILQQTIESTTGLRSNKYSRIHKKEEGWQRPRSMYAVLPGSRNESEEKHMSFIGSRNDNEEKHISFSGSRNENKEKYSTLLGTRIETADKYLLPRSRSENKEKNSTLLTSRGEEKYPTLSGSRNEKDEKRLSFLGSQPEEKFSTLSGSRDENDENSSSFKKKDEEALAGVSVAATTKKLLDASTFSQITPPPTSRKFATLGKPNPVIIFIQLSEFS